MKFDVDWKKVGIFASGFATAVAGIPVLTSKDAKKVYTHVTAAVLRAKETVMTKLTDVRECAGDILSEAEEINELRASEVEVIIDKACDCKVEEA